MVGWTTTYVPPTSPVKRSKKKPESAIPSLPKEILEQIVRSYFDLYRHNKTQIHQTKEKDRKAKDFHEIKPLPVIPLLTSCKLIKEFSVAQLYQEVQISSSSFRGFLKSPISCYSYIQKFTIHGSGYDLEKDMIPMIAVRERLGDWSLPLLDISSGDVGYESTQTAAFFFRPKKVVVEYLSDICVYPIHYERCVGGYRKSQVVNCSVEKARVKGFSMDDLSPFWVHPLPRSVETIEYHLPKAEDTQPVWSDLSRSTEVLHITHCAAQDSVKSIKFIIPAGVSEEAMDAVKGWIKKNSRGKGMFVDEEGNVVDPDSTADEK